MNYRRNLVIVRAGENSLHRQWLDSEKERNWDLFVSWYDDSLYEPVSDENHMFVKGGKWDGIYKTIECALMFSIDTTSFWLPDDDILTSQQAINSGFLN